MLFLPLGHRLVFLSYRQFAEGDAKLAYVPPMILLLKLLCVVYRYLYFRRVCRRCMRNLRADGMLQVSCEPEDGSSVRWGRVRGHIVYYCSLYSVAGVDERAELEELRWTCEKRTKIERNEGQMDKKIREKTSRA